jgi:hypothetical protein
MTRERPNSELQKVILTLFTYTTLLLSRQMCQEKSFYSKAFSTNLLCAGMG